MALLAFYRSSEKIKKVALPIASIILQDIRTLKEVQAHPQIFSEIMPIYYKVDLLRLIFTLETLEFTPTTYGIYCDIDIDSDKMPSYQELFDHQTQAYLDKYGIVLISWDGKGTTFENGFHIIGKNNRNLLISIQSLLIDLNIERGYRAIKTNTLKTLPQIVSLSYRTMFNYFYHKEKYGVLQDSNASSKTF